MYKPDQADKRFAKLILPSLMTLYLNQEAGLQSRIQGQQIKERIKDYASLADSGAILLAIMDLAEEHEPSSSDTEKPTLTPPDAPTA